MQMLSPDHCIVDIIYDHPVLGCLDVAQFQQTLEECAAIKAKKMIEWQGINLKVERTSSIFNPVTANPNYTFVVIDPVT